MNFKLFSSYCTSINKYLSVVMARVKMCPVYIDCNKRACSCMVHTLVALTQPYHSTSPIIL